MGSAERITPHFERNNPTFRTFILITIALAKLQFGNMSALWLFEDNKIKMTKKPCKIQRENPVGCTGEGKR